MGKCRITHVKAPNKKPSILFNKLEQDFGQEDALKTWALTRTESFQKEFGTSIFMDVNGEPSIVYPTTWEDSTHPLYSVKTKYQQTNTASTVKGDNTNIPMFAIGKEIVEFSTQSLLDQAIKKESNSDKLSSSAIHSFFENKQKNNQIVKLGESLFLPSQENLKVAVDIQDKNDIFETLRTEARQEQDLALENALIGLLAKQGVTVEVVRNLETTKGLKALGVADMANKVVKVVEGKATLKTLVEESGHFIYELLGKNNPLIKHLESLALESDTYAEVVEEYSAEYDNNSERILKETVGKLISKYLISEFQKDTDATANDNAVISTIKRVWERIKQIFKNTTSKSIEERIEQTYGKLAVQVLNGTIDLDSSNLENNTNVYYQLEEDLNEEADEDASIPEDEKVEQPLTELERTINKVKNAIQIKIDTLKASGDLKDDSKRKKVLQNLELVIDLLESANINEGLIEFLKKALGDTQQVRKKFQEMLDSNDEVDAAAINRLYGYVEVYTPELIAQIVEELRKSPELDEVIPNQFVDALKATVQTVQTSHEKLAVKAVRQGANTLFSTRTNITTDQIENALNLGSGDISWFRRWTGVLANSPDTLINYGATLINETIEKVRLDSLDEKRKLAALIDEFQKFQQNRGVNKANPRELYDLFYEKKKGKLTGNLLAVKDARATLSEKEFEFYLKFRTFYTKAQKRLPTKFRRGNMLPSIRANEQELIYAGKTKDVAKAWLSESFTIQEDDAGFKREDGLKHVPILYHTQIGSRLNKKGEVLYTGLDPEKVSYDLGNSLLSFSTMSINNFYMNQIVDDLEVLKTVLKDRKVAKMDGKTIITNKSKKYGTEAERASEIDGGTTNAYAQLVLAIDMIVYGEQQSAETVKIPGTSKTVSKNKLANKVLGYVSTNSLAFNLFSSISNAIVGNLQNLIEAAGGQDVDFKSLRKGKKLYWASMAKGEVFMDRQATTPKSLMGQLIEQYDGFQDFSQYHDQFQNNTLMKRLFKKSNLFFLQTGGEHEIQATFLLGYLSKKKVKTSTGEEISLLDAYHQVDGVLELKPGIEYTKEDVIRDTQHFKALSQRMHGVYSEQDLIGAQHEWMGRTALLFRKWVVPTVASRWGKREYNARLDSEIEGRYRTVVDFFWKLRSEAIANEMSLRQYYKVKKGKLEPWQLANLKKTRFSFLTFVAVAALTSLLAGDDDDEEKRSWIANMTLYQLMRLRNEMASYINPIEGLTILRTPSATISMFENVGNLAVESVSAGYGFAFEGEIPRYERDSGLYKKGDAKWLKPFERMFPVWSQIRKSQDPGDNLAFLQWK